MTNNLIPKIHSRLRCTFLPSGFVNIFVSLRVNVYHPRLVTTSRKKGFATNSFKYHISCSFTRCVFKSLQEDSLCQRRCFVHWGARLSILHGEDIIQALNGISVSYVTFLGSRYFEAMIDKFRNYAFTELYI